MVFTMAATATSTPPTTGKGDSNPATIPVAVSTKTSNTMEPPAPIDEKLLKNISSDLTISRGMRHEAVIDWEELRKLHVVDEMGNKIMFCDVFKKQKTIILFVRHFLDFIAKEYVEDVGVIPLEYLQNADVRLVVIGPAPHKFIKAFKNLTGLNYTLYVDPDRQVYKALGCLEKLTTGSLENSKHVKSGFIGGVVTSVWRAMRGPARELQGDVKQQGGSFIMGPGDICHFNHIDQNCTDHCALNDVLNKAGVVNVSFPKDPRVQEV